MFTKRIIPCLDVHNGRVVKGVNFVKFKDAGDPVEIAEAYDDLGTEAIRKLEVENLPAIVVIDSEGSYLYEDVAKKYRKI